MTQTEWLACNDPREMLAYLGADGAQDVRHAVATERKLRFFVAAWWSLFQPHLPVQEERAEDVRAGLRPWQQLLVDCRRHSDGGGDWQRQWDALAPTAAALLRDVVGNPWQPVCLTSGLQECKQPTCQECVPYLTPIVVALARATTTCRACSSSGVTVDHRRRRPVTGKCSICQGRDRVPTGGLDPNRLLVLADALEEGGCNILELLRHLRGQERCWHCLGEGRAVHTRGKGKHPGKDFCHYCAASGFLLLMGPHVRGCWAVDLILGLE